MIPKEMKYNLHYGEVWGNILRPPHSAQHQLITKTRLFKYIENFTTKNCKF